MSLGSKLFGRRETQQNTPTATLSSGNSSALGMERALRFANQPRPKYTHSKKEAIQSALQSLERAVLSIDGAHNVLQETQSLLTTALETPEEIDTDKRSVLAAQVGMMQTQLDSFIKAATFNDLNLIDGHGSQVVIALSEATTGQLIIRRVNLTPQGMGLADLDKGFESLESIEEALTLIDRSIDYVAVQNETFCANATILAEHYQRL